MSLLLSLLSLIGGLLLLVFAAFLIFTAYIFYNHWKYSHIPSPKLPSFYLGHVADIIQAIKETGNDDIPGHDLFMKWYHDVQSHVFVVHFLKDPLVVLLDPEHIKEVTMQPRNNKPEDFVIHFKYLMGERFLGGNSIFTVNDYETWKPKRKLHDPAFNKSYLKTLIAPFNESVNKFLKKLKPLADGKTVVPMKLHLAELTLDVLSKVAFGTDFTEKWNEKTLGLKRIKGNGSLTLLVSHSFKGLNQSIQNALYQYFHPFEAMGYREAARALRMIGRDCIKRRIKSIENEEQVPNDILTHILKIATNKESVEIEDLVDDFVTYYIAGQETTSNLLAFAVTLVHQNPHVLERLRSEIDDVLATKKSVEAEDLEKLQYTEQVLMEALRMYPPVFTVSKCAPKGGLKLGGYHIPAGTHVTMPTSVLCRQPEYFDEPDSFNPSRWDPENKRPSTFVYFPFGIGHRSCIGKHFAMMEATMALARLIQTYKITLPQDYNLVAALRTTQQPKDDVRCTLDTLLG